MNAALFAARAAEIDDQNRRMAGLIVAVASGVCSALLAALILI